MLKNYSFSLLFKANLFLTILLFSLFLWQYSNYTIQNFIFTLLAAISTATLLSAIIYIFLQLFLFHKKTQLIITAFLFIIIDLTLIVDFFIFKLFHFHINAMVLNIIISPDAMDSIQAGIAPLIAFIALVMILIVFEIFVYKKLQHYSPTEKQTLNSKLNQMITIPLILIFFSEKLGYGFATLFSKNRLVAPFKIIPLYQPLTFTKIAAKHFGFKAEEQAKCSIKTDAELNYPLAPLHMDNSTRTFPIFIIAFDAAKQRMITSKITPNITAFAKDALVFEHHYSGGNSTRFGIFSLIYGLNATYWFSFLNSNQKPLLFDILKQRGYDISIISSTNTNWPEFRKTCYVDVQDTIQDSFVGAPWEKDSQSSKHLLALLDQDLTKPLFSFLFLDAPHGYSFPKNENIFSASLDEVNYLAMEPDSKELNATINRYKNALHYDDKRFGEIIKKLKEKGLYDKSLIIFTSDHGQEFFEYGNFGHNTSFSEGQIHVPLILKLPKQMQIQNTKNTSLTSHQDIVPTLLHLLGVLNPSSDYSNGYNLLAPDFYRDYIFSANWNNNAIVTPHVTTVFSNLPNKMFNNEIRDTTTYDIIKNKKTNSKWILDTMNENKKFLK